jgi:hypothetical protein
LIASRLTVATAIQNDAERGGVGTVTHNVQEVPAGPGPLAE